jgi:hypothetical protein
VSDYAIYASPLFDPLRPWLTQLPPRPDSDALRQLADRYPRFTASGRRIRFVPPRADGMPYECRIDERGEVETRPDNWHDFFNALVWLAFPQTKLAVSAAHVQAMQPAGKARGAVRDALTHFDECGMVVLSRQPALLDLLRGFQWKKLFVDQRAAVRADMRFIIFGHATYEQLLSPFRGLTAKAVLYPVADAWLAMPPADQLLAVDRLLAADLASGRYQRPRDFQPLPLLGIPGVTPDNENPAYYEDVGQFRPGRRGAVASTAPQSGQALAGQ